MGIMTKSKQDGTTEIIREWFIGEKVSHKFDAEKPEMAIEIVGKKVDNDGICMYKCSYINKEYMKALGWKKKYFWNSGNQFHSNETC
jgi:hypothetical protein